jgi:hypothetical protein
MTTTPSNPVQSFQPNIVEQLRGLCSPDAERMSDYQRINLMVTAGHAAADRIQELEEALRFIADGYDNQDVNHVDYRVKVYQVALDVLEVKP